MKIIQLYRFFTLSCLIVYAVSELLFGTYRTMINSNIKIERKIYDFVSTVENAGLFSLTLSQVVVTNIVNYSKFANAAAGTAVFVYSLKKIVKKKRLDNTDNNSFPSGHSAITALCLIFLLREKKFRKFYFIFIILALNIYLFRVLSFRHDLLDVICGIILSIIMSFLSCKLNSIFWKIMKFIQDKFQDFSNL